MRETLILHGLFRTVKILKLGPRICKFNAWEVTSSLEGLNSDQAREIACISSSRELSTSLFGIPIHHCKFLKTYLTIIKNTETKLCLSWKIRRQTYNLLYKYNKYNWHQGLVKLSYASWNLDLLYESSFILDRKWAQSYGWASFWASVNFCSVRYKTTAAISSLSSNSYSWLRAWVCN